MQASSRFFSCSHLVLIARIYTYLQICLSHKPHNLDIVDELINTVSSMEYHFDYELETDEKERAIWKNDCKEKEQNACEYVTDRWSGIFQYSKFPTW